MSTTFTSKFVTVDGESFIPLKGRIYRVCWKCGGLGYLPGFEHVDNACCWACFDNPLSGESFRDADEAHIVLEPRRIAREKAAVKRAAKWAKAQAEREAEYATWSAGNLNLIRSLTDHRDRPGMLGDFAAKVAEHRTLTERQVEVATRIFAERAEIDAYASLKVTRHLGAVGDKIEFTGTLKVKQIQDGYHPGTNEWFIVIETPDGDVKITTTASWVHDVAQGDEITLKGTVKALKTYRDQPQTVVTRSKRII